MVCPWRQKNEMFVDRDIASEGVDGYVYVFVENPGKTIVRLREDRYRVDKLLTHLYTLMYQPNFSGLIHIYKDM